MAEFIAERFMVARKEYQCQTCQMDIAPGTRYRRAMMRHEGSVYTWKEHAECAEIGLLSTDFEATGEGYDAYSVTEWLRSLDEEDAVDAVTSDAAKARIRAWFALEEVPDV